MIEHEDYLSEYVRQIKGADDSTAKPAPVSSGRAGRSADCLLKTLIARTFSDDDGESLALVHTYFIEKKNLDVVATKIANLMVKHEGDEAYQQKCREAFARKREESNERILDAMRAWNPGK